MNILKAIKINFILIIYVYIARYIKKLKHVGFDRDFRILNLETKNYILSEFTYIIYI